MPSRFESAVAALAVPALLWQHGTSGTYTAPTAGASAVSGTFIVEAGDATEAQAIGGYIVADDQQAVITARQSEVETVAVGGRFTVDGAKWDVAKAPRLEAGVWVCLCERREHRQRNRNEMS